MGEVMDINHVISGATLLNLMNFVAWLALMFFFRGSYSSKRYQLSCQERVLAQAPAKVIRMFSYPLPSKINLSGAAWIRLTERHLHNVQAASKANDALFVIPWIMALMSALYGLAQLIFMSVMGILQALPFSEFLLSWGITLLSFIPLLATHEFRDSRWRARAPFEWQYLAAALWLLHSTQSTRREVPATLDLYSLTRVEEVLINRFRTLPAAAAPSTELAQRRWRRNIRPLLDEAAVLHLRTAGVTPQTLIDDWVCKSATLIADGGTPKRRGLQFFLAKAEDVSPAGEGTLQSKNRSSTRRVIVWLVLSGAAFFAFAWLADYLSNPQSLYDLSHQARNIPSSTLGVLTATFGLLGSALTAVVSLTPLLRKKNQR